MVHWNGYRTAAVLALLGAFAAGAYGVMTGAMNVALFLVFPVFYGTGAIGFLAILLLFAAFVLWSIGTFKAHADAAREFAGGYGAGGARSNPYGREERYREPTYSGSPYGSRPPESPRYGDARREEDAERANEWARGVEEKRTRVRGGGVIMLGPIPIVFGSDKSTVKWLVVATIILMVLGLAFLLLAGAA